MGGSQFDRTPYIPGEVPRPPAHVQDRLTYVLAAVAILGAGYAAYKIFREQPGSRGECGYGRTYAHRSQARRDRTPPGRHGTAAQSA